MRVRDIELDELDREGCERIRLRRAQIWRLRCEIAALVNSSRNKRTDAVSEAISARMFRLYEAVDMLRQLWATLEALRRYRIAKEGQ